MRVTFWQKTLLALLIVGVVPIAAVNAVSVQQTRDRLTQLGVTNIRERAISTANNIDSYLRGPLGDVVLASKLPAVIAYAQNVTDPDLRRAAREMLSAVASRSPNYESIAIVSIDGTISAASLVSDEGTNVRFRDYFLYAREGLAYISDPSYSVITNRPALFFSSPIQTPGGLVVGVARMRVNLNNIWDLVEADTGSVGAGSHGFLVDDYGIRLAVSETKGHREQAESLIYKPIAPIDAEVAKRLASDRRFGQKTPEQLVIDPLPQLKDALDRGATDSVLAYSSAAGEQRAVAARLRTKPWTYTIAVPLLTYTSAADDSALGVTVAALVGVVLAVLVSLVLARSIVGPLRRLADQAQLMSSGDAALDGVRFEEGGDDVTHDVASALERLGSALRYYVTTRGSAPAGDLR
jgi:C4-dicarboxylate-specific signal transduction histidine kinase